MLVFSNPNDNSLNVFSNPNDNFGSQNEYKFTHYSKSHGGFKTRYLIEVKLIWLKKMFSISEYH